MPTLCIQLLGDFRLSMDGDLVTALHHPRQQALIAYLLLHRHAPQSRRHLAFLFWPDANETQAFTNLRNLLFKVRKELPESARFLEIGAQTVQWRGDAPVVADIALLEAAAAPTATIAQMEQAVQLYRDDLLPSCYDDWIIPERARLRQIVLNLLSRLIDHFEAERDLPQASAYARQRLQLEPLDEVTCRTLIRLYAAADDPDQQAAAHLAGGLLTFASVEQMLNGYSFRFFLAIQKLHELLRTGAIGEVHTVVGAIGVAPLLPGWIAAPATGGGPLLYVGSHLLDELLWLLDDTPVEASATIRYRADTHADDTTTFQLRFARGAVAQGMVTQAGDSFFNRLEFYGHNGRISLRSVLFDYTVEITQRIPPAGVQPLLLRFPVMDDLRLVAHQAQLTEFVQAIAQQRQPSIPVQQGRRVLRVLDALAKSGRTGLPVRLPSVHPS